MDFAYINAVVTNPASSSGYLLDCITWPSVANLIFTGSIFFAGRDRLPNAGSLLQLFDRTAGTRYFPGKSIIVTESFLPVIWNALAPYPFGSCVWYPTVSPTSFYVVVDTAGVPPPPAGSSNLAPPTDLRWQVSSTPVSVTSSGTIAVAATDATPITITGHFKLLFTNPNSLGAPWTYSETRTQAILLNPSGFVAAVESFRMPLSDVPIFPVGPGGMDLGQVVVQIGSTFFPFRVSVFPDRLNVTGRGFDNGVYHINTVVGSVNRALDAAWALAGSPYFAPYRIHFDAGLKLFSVFVPQGPFRPSATRVRVLFSSSLYRLFNTLPTVPTFPGVGIPGMYELAVLNTETNSFVSQGQTTEACGLPAGAYWKMTQTESSLGDWYDFQGLVFLTSLPIAGEYLPGLLQTVAGVVDRSGVADAGPGLPSSRPIIFDFNFEFRGQATVVFNAAGSQRRWVSFNSSVPLTNLSFSCFWQDRRLNLYPLNIPSGDFGSLKIQLRSLETLVSA